MCEPASSLEGAVRAAHPRRVVALDIGTHGSGYSTTKITICNQPGRCWGPVLMHESWPAQPTRYPKTRSAVLYRDRVPVAWGWEAPKKLSELSAAEQASHTLITDFKVALEDAPAAAKLRAKGLSPEQVMGDYLKFFYAYVKQQLRATTGAPPAELDNMIWCMSVPAGWSDESKALMRRAAVRAGIIRQRDDESLSLVLEPEAAALHARETNAPPLTPGMTVCVLDAGGGTVDMTVHEVEERGGKAVLADALWAEGGLCGGTYVDQAFRERYRERVGGDAYDQWLLDHPAEAQQVNERWLALKHSWNPQPQPTVTPAASTSATGTASTGFSSDEDDAQDLDMYRVLIPPRLHALMSSSSRAQLKMEQSGTDSDVLLSQEDMTELFDVSVDAIILMATQHLKRLPAQCSVVILVGGFASSPYLQSRVRQALVQGTRLASQVVVPPSPYAAVMQGAAIYGCCPELIRARRTRMAYGIRQCAPYEPGAPGKFFNESEGCFWTDSLFARMVDKGQQVERDEEVTHYVVPLDHQQREARIKLYTTDSNDTSYVSPEDPNMRRLGELVLSLPPTDEGEELPTLCVKLRFGRAELMAKATDVMTGAEQRATFRFTPAS